MKEIKITSNGIKQAIDDLVDENERLQDKVYKLEDIIKEVREYIGNNKASLPMGRDEFTYEMRYSDPVVLANKLLEILDKVEEK